MASTPAVIPYRVFLSYSRRDVRIVRPLSRLLKGGGLFVWRDEERLEAGQDWEIEIGKAIATSHRVLVFWCSHARDSPAVTDEYEQGFEHGKTVSAVRLDSTTLCLALAPWEAIDVRELTEWHHWRRRWAGTALAGVALLVLAGVCALL